MVYEMQIILARISAKILTETSRVFWCIQIQHSQIENSSNKVRFYRRAHYLLNLVEEFEKEGTENKGDEWQSKKRSACGL